MVTQEWYKMKNTQIDHFLFLFVHTILTNQEITLLNGEKQKQTKVFSSQTFRRLKPGFHIVVSVVSVVSVVRKKIHRTDITLWKPPVQMLNTKEMTDTTFLPPQGFGLWAKTRGGILGFPACIHIRNFKMYKESTYCK